MNSTRRSFLGQAAMLSMGSVLADTAGATEEPAKNPRSISPLPEMPSRVFIDHDSTGLRPAVRAGTGFTTDRASVGIAESAGGQEVRVHCPKAPLARVMLRWDYRFPIETLFLGDHWERSYGDLQWRPLQPERIMPWYFTAHHLARGMTFMAGVKTQPSALCFWMADASGISLWLDFRNGGSPCIPGDREIAAATVVSLVAKRGESPFAALRRFCRLMCPTPRLPSGPICGNNNWYYTYGQGFDAEATLRDATLLADLAAGHANRPYCVIDAGWNPGGGCPGGPWDAGDAKRFPDMPGLAMKMKGLGVRPSIWVRPTALTTVDDPRRLRPGPCSVPEKPLDLTFPDNLALIHQDIARIRSWGYELIKHDFSTYDILARWGFEMGAQLTDGGWHFADQSLTNAEIILRLYRTLRDAAGDVLLLGCNTMGHLGAGLFEIQRTGDDTSGRAWERTRRMGVNTLAYRLPQHGAFFINDADCAAHTEYTPWEFDRQFLELVARSGTALFISVDPRTIQAEEKKAFRAAVQTALSGTEAGKCEALDWLYSTTPCRWRFGREQTTFHWEEATGASPFRA